MADEPWHPSKEELDHAAREIIGMATLGIHLDPKVEEPPFTIGVPIGLAAPFAAAILVARLAREVAEHTEEEPAEVLQRLALDFTE